MINKVELSTILEMLEESGHPDPLGAVACGLILTELNPKYSTKDTLGWRAINVSDYADYGFSITEGNVFDVANLVTIVDGIEQLQYGEIEDVFKKLLGNDYYKLEDAKLEVVQMATSNDLIPTNDNLVAQVIRDSIDGVGVASIPNDAIISEVDKLRNTIMRLFDE